MVADVLASSGLPAGRLRLELKERVLQGAPTTARRNLAALQELGVGFALDDFGTGYSSLRDLPVRAVKIDRSFVHALATSPGDAAIVAAIVSLARALDIAAVAEGVETEDQADAPGRARLPVRAGLSLRRARPPDNLRAVTTFEELDALSSRELHDRAVKRAERHFDLPFFWRLLSEAPAAEAAEGDVESNREEVAHWSRQVLDVLRHDDDGARSAPPDLHRLPARTLGIARITPSGGLCRRPALTRARAWPRGCAAWNSK